MQSRLMKATAGAVLAAGMMWAQSTTPAPQPGQNQGQDRGRMMMRNPQQRFQRLANYLNLTAQQREQAKAIMQDARTAAQPVVAQLKTGRQALADAVKTGKSDAEIDRLATSQGVLQGQMIAIRTKAFEKVYALLTPEQRQKADDLHNLFGAQTWRNRAARRSNNNG